MLVLLAQNCLIIQMAISNNPIDSGFTSTYSPFSNAYTSTRPNSPSFMLLGWMLVFAVLLLTACGPEKPSQDQAQLRTETQRIAQEYQANGNLEQARTQINRLPVANPGQWLVYVAETAIAENNDQALMLALAHLVTAMDLQSEPVAQFALQHNLGKKAPAIAANLNQPIVAPVPTLAVEPQKLQLAALPAESTALTQTIISSAVTATNQTTIAQVLTTQALSNTLILTPTAAADTNSTKLTAKASQVVNVRNGPDTAYSLIGALQAGDTAEIIAKNDAGDWWEVNLGNNQQGWIYGQLVETSGDLTKLAVAIDIPALPPTATPAPVVDIPTATSQPVAQAPVEPTAAPAPPVTGNDFVMTEHHLWDVIENGGQLDGPSVTCGQGRELIVNVLDANGNRINGVAVQVQYGAREIYVTGAQGKGDGVAEFVLGSGQDVKVIKDTDGHDVSSDVATGLTTKPWDIPYETLIGAQYCQDDASCKNFADHTGCYGHYSWTVTFKRQH